jgi:hypothetical protein
MAGKGRLVIGIGKDGYIISEHEIWVCCGKGMAMSG